MTTFKSWSLQEKNLFELRGGAVSSKLSKPLDIKNYIRANRYYTRSDIRLKNNIKDLTESDLDKLNNLVPKSYNLKNSKGIHFGFIAQDVEKEFPNLVSKDSDGMKSVNYLEMVPILLHKINNLEKKVEELTKKTRQYGNIDQSGIKLDSPDNWE